MPRTRLLCRQLQLRLQQERRQLHSAVELQRIAARPPRLLPQPLLLRQQRHHWQVQFLTWPSLAVQRRQLSNLPTLNDAAASGHPSTERLKVCVGDIVEFIKEMDPETHRRLQTKWHRQMNQYKRDRRKRQRFQAAAAAVANENAAVAFMSQSMEHADSSNDGNKEIDAAAIHDALGDGATSPLLVFATDTVHETSNGPELDAEQHVAAQSPLLQEEDGLFDQPDPQHATSDNSDHALTVGFEAPNSAISSEGALMEGLCLLRAMSRRDFAMYDLADVVEDDVMLVDDGGDYDNHVQSQSSNGENDEVEATETTQLESQEQYVAATGHFSSLQEAAEATEIVDLVQEINAILISPDTFDTLAFNVLLLRLSLTTDYSKEAILETIMMTMQRIQQLVDAGADAIQLNHMTYEIVLHALNKRLLAFNTGTGFIRELLHRRAPWNSYSLRSAMQMCEKTSNLDLAIQLLMHVSDDSERSFSIPAPVFQTVINMAKRLDRVDDAANVAKICLRGHLRDRPVSQLDTDAVLLNAIRWPDRSRTGQFVDNTAPIRVLLDVLDEFPGYRPGFYFWKEAVHVTAKGAGAETKQRWQLVNYVFSRLSVDVKDYWPNNTLFAIGLNASEALVDSSLAADLVRRVVAYKQSKPFQTQAQIDSHAQSNSLLDVFSLLDLERAVMICLHDSAALRSLLESIFDMGDQVPLSFQQHLFELGVKGYAANRDADTAEALLITLIDRGFDLHEDTYGAVVYAFAMSKQPDQALLLFEDMVAGELPCKPGPASYNGLIIGHTLSAAWSETLVLYGAMKDKEILPLPSTHHAALLASYRLGGKDAATVLLEELIASDAPLSVSTCKLAAKFVLDLPGKVGALSSDSLCDLVGAATDDETLELLRRIMGAWRSAEQREESIATGSLGRPELEKRRHQAWGLFLGSLTRYAKVSAHLTK